MRFDERQRATGEVVVHLVVSGPCPKLVLHEALQLRQGEGAVRI